MIKPGYKKNFDTLCKAFTNGDVALMECSDAKTGKPVIAICMVSLNGDEFVMAPVAKMFDGNPYEELLPPHGSLDKLSLIG